MNADKIMISLATVKAGIVLTLGIGIIATVLSGGCGENSSSNPTEYNPASVIIVDRYNPNAVSSPCGTVDAVCRTITDGVRSAALLNVAIPTVLIKPGTYDAEPAFPIRIQFPVLLKSEQEQQAVLKSSATTLTIESSGVIIEGCQILTNGVGDTTTVEINGGSLLLRKNGKVVNIGHPADPRGTGVKVNGGGNLTVEESAIETTGTVGIDMTQGTALIQQSWLRATDAAVSLLAGGSVTLNDNQIEGNVFTTGGSLTLNNNVVKDVTIADGGSGNLTGNTIQGWVSLLWKHAQATLQNNTIYGRFSVVEGEATLENNRILGNEYGEGVTLFNFADVTLTNNQIFGANTALLIQTLSSAVLSRNQFDSASSETPIIQCDPQVTISTDGANTLRHADRTIACDGLPTRPGTNPF